MTKLILAVIIALLGLACSSETKSLKLITVTGEIPVSEMNITLVHEHILVDFIGADSTGYHRWEKAEVIERALPILMEAKANGLHTFFECTPAYLGRDPLLLKELSEKTGINIVTNTGYYGVRENKFIPRHVFEMSSEALAQLWINEHQNGIEETGIYPGFIKIGVDRKDTLSPMHQKLIRAAAIAHKATGLTIVSHTGTEGPAFAQIEILKEEGVSAEAFVWTHAQHGTLEACIKAAKMGAWISTDNVQLKPSKNSSKPGRIEWYVDRLTEFKNAGILNKILLSHDSGWYRVGEKNGGIYRGYNDIFEYLIPALLEKGFTQQDIDQLLKVNPQNAYGVHVREIN